MKNRSPWIVHLGRTRSLHTINADRVTDIAIVGGGIAGVATAYFILKNTGLEVTLLEAGRIAHGATGHNAGQLLSYFERPFSDMVKEFGLEKTAQGQQAIDSTWELLEDMRRDMRLETPLYRFTGYAGLSNKEQILQHLNDNAWRLKAGIEREAIFIANDTPLTAHIPAHYASLYTSASTTEIQKHLEANDPQYIALLTNKRGSMNSARFTEELVEKLLAKYGDRFTLSEDTPVSRVTLSNNETRLTTNRGIITATKTILCTNGFEYISIKNQSGKDIDTAFHHEVNGVIGYMTGYVLPNETSPAGMSYLMTAPPKSITGDPYFYVTRGPHEGNLPYEATLLCIGGPDYDLPDRAQYEQDHDYLATAEQEIDGFVRMTYEDEALQGAKPEFRWQGLMGYTPNRIRLIGQEPHNHRLLYNLGCNGIGILPSIYGGYRIAKIVNGEQLEPSIFDPKMA